MNKEERHNSPQPIDYYKEVGRGLFRPRRPSTTLQPDQEEIIHLLWELCRVQQRLVF